MPARSAALPGATLADLGRRERLARRCMNSAGEDDDREEEIGERPGGDDRRALAEPLVVERDLALLRRHRAERSASGVLDGVGVAEHLDVAAERDRS